MSRFTDIGVGVFLVILLACTKTELPQQDAYLALIEQGEFSQARSRITILLKDSTVSQAKRTELEFEIERLSRIEKDFTQNETEVNNFIKTYIPDVKQSDLQRWESEKSLEVMLIDGQKRYFDSAARNLFRIDQECRKIWADYHKNDQKTEEAANALNLDEHIKTIMTKSTVTDSWVEPVRMLINFTISVKPDRVPQGETIRCWIPFPREIPRRQYDITILNAFPNNYQVADNSQLQRTIYFEQPSAGSAITRFNVVYEYTSFGTYTAIDPAKVQKVDPQGELKQYLQEEPPHLVFTPELLALSRQIIGQESNPYRLAQKLFEWVDLNIPWASAREYSTIGNLSMYPYDNRHGDCGIQTMLFMTLCRINGIPTRWQSGWEFQPPDDSMHDWGMIYFEPYGWVPMDVTYGLRESENENHRWFYLSGMDSYRLIFNDAYAQAFEPAKRHFRSETIDSQRGEVEWQGGNLYFDQWDWEMQWQVLNK